MAAGRLNWTKAQELIRVVTPETEPTWVERALVVTSRVLERQVAAASSGDAAPVGGPNPERFSARSRVCFAMEAADAEVLRAALVLLRSRSELDRLEVEDGALLAAMARSVIAAEEATLPDDSAERASNTDEGYRVVIQPCPTCWNVTGPDGDVSRTIAAEARCDAEIIDLRPAGLQCGGGRAFR